MPRRTNQVLLVIEVDGDVNDVAYVLGEMLDSGSLQDAIHEAAEDLEYEFEITQIWTEVR